MKVFSSVIEKYEKLCPLSTMKAPDKTDIIHKIHRAITLGQVIDIQDGGDTLIVRYYHNNYKIKHNNIVAMWMDRDAPIVEVDEKVKKKYDEQVTKSLVASAW